MSGQSRSIPDALESLRERGVKCEMSNAATRDWGDPRGTANATLHNGRLWGFLARTREPLEWPYILLLAHQTVAL
ncbi:hypothetical protein C8Q80DRAFT_1178292 [Daedaleopsis nitida]|nr:hypothetical protein C8Q80DRAFT_1178292 [Daedaleopsis nitida]